jgi:hypothetical protein
MSDYEEFQRSGPQMDLNSYPAWAQGMMQAAAKKESGWA